ncbi:MAG: hypothetical protein L3K02_04600 [Thermoplasmata archaeon]|nr:hypothetical protein [Thermoplasmata archaeon]
MSLPRGWPLLGLAGVAIGLAIYAGPNQGVATAGALVGLVAIAIFVLGPARHAAVDLRSATLPRPVDLSSPFEVSLRAGRSGRSEVVAMLDELERRTGRPELPTTPALEVVRLRALPRVEFREYVRERLDGIDGAYR